MIINYNYYNKNLIYVGSRDYKKKIIIQSLKSKIKCLIFSCNLYEILINK